MGRSGIKIHLSLKQRSARKVTVSFSIILMILHVSAVIAQDPVMSQPFESVVLLNPALAGSDANGRIISFNRLQWPGISGLGNLGISADVPLATLHGGLGFNLLQQIEGSYFRRTRTDLIYAWEGNLSPQLAVSAALQASWLSYRWSPSNAILPGNIDPQTLQTSNSSEFLSSGRRGFPDFSAGMAGSWKNLFFGSSVHHLFRPDILSTGYPAVYLPVAWNAHAGWNISTKTRLLSQEPLLFSPNILIFTSGYDSWVQIGSYMVIKPLYSGLWFRRNRGGEYTSIIALLGFTGNNFRLALSYDTDFLSSLYLPGNGAYELTGTLKFNVPAKRKRIKAIKCPKI